jgi:hypothetical protein
VPKRVAEKVEYVIENFHNRLGNRQKHESPEFVANELGGVKNVSSPYVKPMTIDVQ